MFLELHCSTGASTAGESSRSSWISAPNLGGTFGIWRGWMGGIWPPFPADRSHCSWRPMGTQGCWPLEHGFFWVSAPTLLPVLLWLYPPVRRLQWSRRYCSNTLQGKRSKFTKNSDNKDMPRLEFLSTASLLISRMQVHSHLFGLLKRSIPWRQEPQTYSLSQKFLSATRTYGMSFNGVATAIATLPRTKKLQVQESRIYLCDHDHCTYNYCCTCRYINSSIR